MNGCSVAMCISFSYNWSKSLRGHTLATNIEIFESGRDALNAIVRAAAGAQTILIGVAYVTRSGLNELLPHLKVDEKKRVSFLCGIGDISAHEPAALQELQSLSKVLVFSALLV